MQESTLIDKLREFAQKYNIDFDESRCYPAPVVAYQCDRCCDKGVIAADVPVSDPLFGKTFECDNPNCEAANRNRSARYARLCNLSQLPTDYQQWTFRNWIALYNEGYTDLYAGKLLGYGAAVSFVAQRRQNHYFTLSHASAVCNLPVAVDTPTSTKNSLMLQGPPGVSKTALAACIVNALLAESVSVVYARVSDVLAAVKERFDRQSQDGYEFDYGNSAEGVKSTFKKAPVLVLDEFNLSKTSDFSKQTMEDIVRYRMSNQLPTVMTCNIGFDEFQDPSNWDYRTGHAVQGMAHWITVGGAELRPRGKAVKSL